MAKTNDVQGTQVDLSSEDRRASAKDTLSQATNAYSNAAQEADLSTGSERQEDILNNLTPDQFYKIYGYWNWNLAKNNAKGNLNNKTYGNNLYNSRLADAFNNRKYWKAARIGHRTNSGFGSTGLQQGQAVQYNPIETQETRQQRANEQIDLLARQGQQNLATQMQGYKFNVQQNADKIRQGLSELITKNKIDLNKHAQESIWDEQYKGSWDAYWQNSMARFAKELDQDIKNRVLNAVNKLDAPLKQIYMSLQGGTAPDLLTDIAYKYINNSLGDLEPGSEAYNAALMEGVGRVASLFGEGIGTVLKEVLSGLFGGK